MDFTREPIIETVITPKEGCKIVVRSSKSAGQEEYFVDAVEVVSFGNALFYRSVERPKAFLVPASDYEILEVREARMVLKNVGIDRTIKIGGSREQAGKQIKEPEQQIPAMPEIAPPPMGEGADSIESKVGKLDKRREKRHHRRRRRGREDGAPTGESTGEGERDDEASVQPAITGAAAAEKPATLGGIATPPPLFSSLLPPPPTLISETIARYRDNVMFKDAFFSKEEQEEQERVGMGNIETPMMLEDSSQGADDFLEALEMQKMTLEPSAYGSFDHIEENEHEVREEESDTLDVAPEDQKDFPK